MRKAQCENTQFTRSENFEFAKIEMPRSEKLMSAVRMEKRKERFPVVRLF